MAHIRQQRGRWRAEIERNGVRRSASFDTPAEADAWAREIEQNIKARAKLRQAVADSTLLSRLPRRAFEAMASISYSSAEVVRGAISAHPCGVYFLIHEAEITYIGQSIDVFTRISKHRRNGIVFDSFNVIPCKPDELDELEERYITAIMPRSNASFGRRSRTCES